MKTYLENSFSTDKLNAQLNDPYCAYYFAKLDHQIIGYLKLNSGLSQTELKEENALEIERIYVLKEFQGKKVGQRLLEKAIQIARELEVEFLWLGVWDENPDAIRFYQKNGFVEFDRHIFMLGKEVQTDILMKLPILGKMV